MREGICRSVWESNGLEEAGGGDDVRGLLVPISVDWYFTVDDLFVQS
jgi:hypothetical protein